MNETLYENSFYAMNPFNNAGNDQLQSKHDDNLYIPVAKQSTQVDQEFIPGSKQFTLSQFS